MQSTQPQRGFLRHAMIYGAGTLLLQAGAIILLPLYTRYLTPAEYGIYDIIGRLAEVINVCFMVNGIRMAAFTFYSQRKTQGGDATAVSATVIVLCALCLGVALSWVCGTPLRAYLGVADQRLVSFGVAAILLEMLTGTPLALMQARTESVAFVVVSCTIFATRTGLIFFTVVALRMGIWGILLSSAITSAVAGVLLTWRELNRSSYRPRLSQMRAMTAFALPFVPGGALFFVLQSSDRFFLLRYTGATGTGIYALGVRIASAVALVTVTPLFMVWSSRMYAAAEQTDAAEKFGCMFRRILAAYVFAALGVAIYQNDLIRAIAGTGYAEVHEIVAPLLIAYLLLRAAGLMDAAFYVRHRTILKPFIALGATVTALGAQQWAVPRFGITGAAWATVAAYGTLCACTAVVSQRVFTVLYDWPRIIGALLMAIAIFGCSLLCGSGPLGLVAKGVLLALWPVLLWTSGVLTIDDKQAVRAIVASLSIRIGKRDLITSPDPSCGRTAVGYEGLPQITETGSPFQLEDYSLSSNRDPA